MIDPHLYLAFTLATAILVLIPGPNVALIIANSVRHGLRYGLLTIAGTSCAIALQLCLAVAGLSGFLTFFGAWFEWLRWAGVIYLLVLGITAWRSSPAEETTSPTPASVTPDRRFVTRGFLVSMTNPKVLLFYGAFFPQFIDADGNRPMQLLVLAATFLAMTASGDCLWAVAASRMRLTVRLGTRAVNRITGGVLVTGAAGLALAHKP